MEFLQVNGFERRDFIFEPGEFSVRGGIVDLFSFAHEYPFRIDLDGDIIESIRTFDVNDQLSLKEIAHFSLLPNIQEQRNQETTFSITDYFDPKTIVVAQDMAFQIEDLAKAWEKALQVHQEAVDFGREVIPKHPKQIWNTPKGFVAVLDPFTQIHFSGNRPTGKVDIIEFYQQPQPLFKRNFPMLIDWMQQNEKDGYKTLVFSENSRQIERLTTILADTNAQATFDPVYQGLSAGFVDRDVKIAFATEHQLFDKYYRPKGRQKYSSQTSLTLRELKNLKPGDFVTHIDHGIGRFAGLEKMDVYGVTQEVVRIVYKDNDLLYVSVNSLHKISKYTGKDGTPPSMHKLGSPQWDKQKKATKKKVKDIARELIALYAKRKAQQGFAFGPDNYLQMELEASFFMKIPLIRERQWRIPNAIWNRHSPWIDWCVVMWVSAKRKLPCAQRSKRSAIANKWQCLCPQPFWRNNTIALLPNDSLAFPLPWIISIGLNQPRNKKLHSTKSRTER